MQCRIVEMEIRGGNWWAKVEIPTTPGCAVSLWLRAPEARDIGAGQWWELGLTARVAGKERN